MLPVHMYREDIVHIRYLFILGKMCLIWRRFKPPFLMNNYQFSSSVGCQYRMFIDVKNICLNLNLRYVESILSALYTGYRFSYVLYIMYTLENV